MFIQTDLSYLKQNIEDIENTMFNLLIENLMEIYVICESGELKYPIGFKTMEQAEETIRMSKNNELYIEAIKIIDGVVCLDTMFS